MIEQDLLGRRALVTGAAGGLGGGICRELAARGAVVVVSDRTGLALKTIANEVGAEEVVEVDLVDRKQLDEVAATLGDMKIDILASNAGWNVPGGFLSSRSSDWDQMIELNLRSHLALTHAVLPGMVERGWGRLVYTSSETARHGLAGSAVYAAAKAGLIAFAKSIARETASAGVTANCVLPGLAATPLYLTHIAHNDEGVLSADRSRIPLGRFGSPDDIGGLVGYIASPRAEYITGQAWSVSGGLTMA